MFNSVPDLQSKYNTLFARLLSFDVHYSNIQDIIDSEPKNKVPPSMIQRFIDYWSKRSCLSVDDQKRITEKFSNWRSIFKKDLEENCYNISGLKKLKEIAQRIFDGMATSSIMMNLSRLETHNEDLYQSITRFDEMIMRVLYTSVFVEEDKDHPAIGLATLFIFRVIKPKYYKLSYQQKLEVLKTKVRKKKRTLQLQLLTHRFYFIRWRYNKNYESALIKAFHNLHSSDEVERVAGTMYYEQAVTTIQDYLTKNRCDPKFIPFLSSLPFKILSEILQILYPVEILQLNLFLRQSNEESRNILRKMLNFHLKKFQNIFNRKKEQVDIITKSFQEIPPGNQVAFSKLLSLTALRNNILKHRITLDNFRDLMRKVVKEKRINDELNEVIGNYESLIARLSDKLRGYINRKDIKDKLNQKNKNDE